MIHATYPYGVDPWRDYAVEVLGYDAEEFDRLVRYFRSVEHNA